MGGEQFMDSRSGTDLLSGLPFLSGNEAVQLLLEILEARSIGIPDEQRAGFHRRVAFLMREHLVRVVAATGSSSPTGQPALAAR